MSDLFEKACEIVRADAARITAERLESFDMTGKIADAGMYSYERPASLFWNGFAAALIGAGYSEAEVEDILRSKLMRWNLDDSGGRVEALGREMGAEFAAKRRGEIRTALRS